MKYFACRGFDTYALDARGFGGSSMPKQMLRPAEDSPPLIRAKEVQKKISILWSIMRAESAKRRK